jgi:tetratricopeptide (TPR) repeat protein
LSVGTFAQKNAEKQGAQAWMNGDFKTAVVHLERADAYKPNNMNVLKMLAYSYFQTADYVKASDTYTRLLNAKPGDYTAYYYRGKARLNLANNPKISASAERESLYNDAISDFTKAMEISGTDEVQILQNRGIAYKDYGIFKSYLSKKKAERAACIALLNNSVTDLQKILIIQPLRKDISSLIDYVKAQIASLK